MIDVIKMAINDIVDVAKIEGLGDFTCSICGSNISPDDTTEDNYKILEIRLVDRFPDEVLLQCNECQNIISVIGFDVLKEHVKDETSKTINETSIFPVKQINL
jgi:hypothetical protein